ncbi:MAG: hypothetical protein H7062_08895 [Candidatus Saccharimonas sp.]|nr:hypothetical protein [Planctomycetaceae bacterium]
MGLGVTVCFYLVFGIGVAAALWIGDAAGSQNDRLFRVLTAPLFWPLYLPVLLTPRPAENCSAGLMLQKQQPQPAPRDEMATAIAQVEVELDTALRSLDGWAEDVLAAEHDRFAELRTAWRQQAERVRELDCLLAQSSFDVASPASTSAATPVESPTRSRIQTCERTRTENLLKLKHVRQQLHDDLMATLAWVRELVTMIHLAKYTGAPASRAAELVQQIAAAVEGLSEVTAWVDDPRDRSPRNTSANAAS